MKKDLILIVLVVSAAVAMAQLLDPRGYAVRVVCLVLLAACLGQCWNIMGGLANQISLGHAAFFGIGAYTSSVLQLRYGLSPWLGMPAGMLLAVVAALLLALPTMRLRGPYFALATLAFGEACRILATALTGVTGGPQGISVPFVGNSWAMMQFRGAGNYLYLYTGLFVLIYAVFSWLSRGRNGYLLRAVRENEDAAEVAGVDTLKVKLTGAVISAALTAAMGTLFAQFVFFLEPDSVFNASAISIRAALIAIVGGVGTLAGPLVGALIIVPLEELLTAWLSNSAAGIAPFFFGVALIAIVLWRPSGVVSVFAKSKRSAARKATPPHGPALGAGLGASQAGGKP